MLERLGRRMAAFSMALALVSALGAVLGACALLDDVADDRLGIDCDTSARIFRAAAFADTLSRQYGEPSVGGLREAVDLMREAAAAGADLTPAGDAYKFRFVALVVDQLKVRGMEVATGNYRAALERLKEIPTVGAEINLIEARVGIMCARAGGPAAGGAGVKP